MLLFCILGLLPLPLGLAMSHIFVISSYQWGLPTLFLFPASYPGCKCRKPDHPPKKKVLPCPSPSSSSY